MQLSLSNMLGPRLSLAGAALVGGQQTLGRWADGAYFAYDATKDKGFLNYGRRLVPLTGIPGISITRATSAYYTDAQGNLTLFPSGAARIGNRGLLVEGAATNLCLQSQTFAKAPWLSAGTISMSPVDNQAVAPDGTTTAAELQEENTASGTRAIINNFTPVSGTTYALSVYAKAGTATAVQVLGGSAGFSTGVWATFDLSTGAVGASGASTTASIQALANGWYRCTVIGAATASSAGAGIGIVMVDSPTASRLPTYAPAEAKSCYIWQAQAEATAYATSPIVTTTGSATRNADVISIGSVTGLSYPVTLFAEAELAVNPGVSMWAFTVSDGTSAEKVQFGVSSGRVGRIISTAGSVQQASVTAGAAVSVGAVFSVAGRVATNDVNVARGGSAGTADTSATNPATPTTIHLGSDVGAVQPLGGYLRRLAIFPSAYSDAQLQALAPA